MNRSQILTPLTPACFSPSFSLSLSLTSTTHLLHIPSLGFWVEDHEGSHPPPTPTLSCALGNGTGNQQSSPLTEITRAFLAERVEEESSVLLIPCPQHGLWFQLTIPTMTMWKASSGAEGSANPGISAALTPTLCLVCN